MKTGKTMMELAAEVDRQRESKKDYIADSSAMEMTVSASVNYPRLKSGSLPIKPRRGSKFLVD